MIKKHPIIQLFLLHLRDFWREPAAIFWSVIFPITLAAVLGVAFTSSKEPVKTIGVVPNITSSVKAIEDAHPEKYNFLELTREEAELEIKRGKINLIIDTDQELLQYRFDPKNAEAKNTYLELENDLLTLKNPSPREVKKIKEVGTRYIDFLIPGLLALGIMNSCLWGISWSMIEFRIKKLLRRMVATPMKKSHFLLSMATARTILSFIEAMLVLAFAVLVFGLKIQGNIFAFFLMFLSGIFAFSGIAVIISSRAEKTQVGNGLINAVSLPMTILSGIFFSYQNFPDWSVKIIKFLPLTLLSDGIREIFNEGVGLETEMFYKSGILILTGLIFSFIGLKMYKWH